MALLALVARPEMRGYILLDEFVELATSSSLQPAVVAQRIERRSFEQMGNLNESRAERQACVVLNADIAQPSALHTIDASTEMVRTLSVEERARRLEAEQVLESCMTKTRDAQQQLDSVAREAAYWKAMVKA
eukprot:SAG11_NODE_2943_length_2820_cov_3.553105_2_plen_132_part_00